jgi:hypothetical protein
MNSRGRGPVEAALRLARPVTWALAVTAVIGSPACVDINGGAVELSWALRDFEGKDVGDCMGARLDEVAVCWQLVEDGSSSVGAMCDADRSAAFACAEENGVSRFEIVPGSNAFWIEPRCTDGDPPDLGTYEVPPPIVRTVEDGRIVTLNSLLIVVAPAGVSGSPCPEAGCTCAR